MHGVDEYRQFSGQRRDNRDYALKMKIHHVMVKQSDDP
jgi:hypothetical protein